MTNNVKQEEYKPTFSDIVDLVRDEWNSYSKDGDIGYAKAAVLVDKAIEPQVNQQVIQALETLRNKSEGGYTVKQLEKHSPLGVVAKPVVSLSVIDNIIKEYKGE